MCGGDKIYFLLDHADAFYLLADALPESGSFRAKQAMSAKHLHKTG
ncbi:MAG: hypothetical protein N838_29290 [Thiohalocapsa sp. PB-PSB1]|jgi:hypothetical protein|nr:MAG: hypothetical protein N838_29290 [Thiohalocapsa sp. PB-PSB1]